jgi:hypothetical protein
MVPVNIHVYSMNLTAANMNPDSSPDWYYHHDFIDDYKISDLSPNTM